MHRVYPDYVHPEAAIRDWDYEARTDCKEDVSVLYSTRICVVDLLVYQIMRRDDYTCFITHALDLSTPDERSQAHGGWKANLEPCPIVKLAASAINDGRDHGSKVCPTASVCRRLICCRCLTDITHYRLLRKPRHWTSFGTIWVTYNLRS